MELGAARGGHGLHFRSPRHRSRKSASRCSAIGVRGTANWHGYPPDYDLDERRFA